MNIKKVFAMLIFIIFVFVLCQSLKFTEFLPKYTGGIKWLVNHPPVLMMGTIKLFSGFIIGFGHNVFMAIGFCVASLGLLGEAMMLDRAGVESELVLWMPYLNHLLPAGSQLQTQHERTAGFEAPIQFLVMGNCVFSFGAE